MILSRDQAVAAANAAAAERDGISANLLELDGSFGKRLLAGASLTGQTRQRWDGAAAELAALWDTFTAYSGVVDAAADLAARTRLPARELAELSSLLTEPSVRLVTAPRPLARRDLTETGQVTVTLATAVARMRPAFAAVTEVTSAAEAVWNAIAGPLADVRASLDAARLRAADLADQELVAAADGAIGDLRVLRDLLNGDPLALWGDGQVDSARLDQLRQRAGAVSARAATLTGIREDATRRMGAARSAADGAGLAWQDALAARERALAKIMPSALPDGPLAAGRPPPGLADLRARAAALDGYAAAGRWAALAAEIDLIERRAAELTSGGRAAEQAAAALLSQREELRGLLDAYQAKAARLGGAEDEDLTRRYQRARDLLWTAPCDLRAAAEAVTDYQRAILAFDKRGLTR